MRLQSLLQAVKPPARLKCDVVVIGGGSGGLACAQAAARRGASVVLCDFVTPSETRGTTWGFGGTCVNVGCVPKKLFHRSGLLGQIQADGEFGAYGYSGEKKVAEWTTVVQTVQSYLKMLNFTYTNALPENCKYVNGKARFEDDGKRVIVEYADEPDVTVVEASQAIVIAVGGRPIIPSDIRGAKEHAITSDDIFSLKKSPGKSLVIGSSYIGLETASFLQGMGLPTSILIRSRPLRGDAFDAQCAAKVLNLMKAGGVRVLTGGVVNALEKSSDKILAQFSDGSSEDFDTVMLGTGRRPETHKLNLPSDIAMDNATGKILVNDDFIAGVAKAQGAPRVFAIGDCANTGSPELTPVAIRQGELVASLITKRSLADLEKRRRSLKFVPSSVFTLPSEYSCVGLSEAQAISTYGEDDVEVYLKEWQPLEASAAHVRTFDGAEDAPFRGFAKLICAKSLDNRIVGLHLITPNSSEAIHGLALACSLGASKEDFDARVLGIHPTDGEALTDMMVSKSSGLDFKVAAGCGGGKCG